MEIKFTGMKAVAVIAVIIVFLMAKLTMSNEALQNEGVQAIEQWLLMESARQAIPDMEKAMEHMNENAEYLEQMANDLQQSNFEIISVTRHGFSEKIVVRAEIRFKGEEQTEDINVRYFKMSYSMVTGWRGIRESSKWNYYLAAL